MSGINAYSQSAYAQANAANILASSSYNSSNAVNIYANSAYAFANNINAYAFSTSTSANANISYILAYGLAANANMSGINTYSQSAYARANSGISSSGYTSNSIIFANTSGYLSNTTNLSFYSSNNTLVVPNLQVTGSYSESSNTPLINTGVLTLDLTQGAVFNVSINSSISSINITNVPSSGKVATIDLIFNYTGLAISIAWPSAVRWPNGVAPTLTTTAGKRDIFSFLTIDGGNSFNGIIAGQNL
jgi:hypothetical protein